MERCIKTLILLCLSLMLSMNALSMSLCAPSSTQLQNAISSAKGFIDRLYETLGYAYVKEYPAFPIGVKTPTQINLFINIGESKSKTFNVSDSCSAQFSSFQSTIISQNSYSTTTSFTLSYFKYGSEASKITIGFALSSSFSGGSSTYRVQVNSFSGYGWLYLYPYEIYLATEKILTITKDTSLPVYVDRTKSSYACYPSHRYTVRHASQLTDIIYRIWGTPKPLDAIINDYGFTYDIYDPMFGLAKTESDNFMFTTQAYHDVDVYDSLPRGIHYYPYKSKVSIDRDLYIELSKDDPLLRGMWAIHILNKYGNPDISKPLADRGNTTPRQVARWIEANYWNGYGVYKPLSGSQYASGIRSAVFLVLETLLGYKYGDSTSKNYADTLADVLVNAQFTNGYIETDEHGVIYRPFFKGAFPHTYKTGSSYPYAVPPKNIFEQIIDLLGMPKETDDLTPSNTETVALVLQSLRVYLYYKYSTAYPSSNYLP